MANNEVETLLNEEENQVLLTKEEPVVQQQEESADFLDENANMYSDSYRKSVFDGGTAIYPYGKDNTAIYLNDPKIDEEFKEDLFQKHLEVNAPKKKVDPFKDMTLDEIQEKLAAEKKEKQLGDVRIFGEQPYVTEYNNKQVQTLRKHKIPSNIEKILVEGNFALPFERNTGYVEDANKTIGMLSMVDGLWDNYIAFPPNFLKDNAAKQSQKKLELIQAAIRGDWGEMPTLMPSGLGRLRDKTLEELDIMRGEEQVKMEIFLDGKIPTSTQWWQNRIRKELGVEVPLEVLEDLKKDAGGFMSKTTGYTVDFAPIAVGFTTVMYKKALKKYKEFQPWLHKFKKTKAYNKDMTDKDLYNAFMKDKFPTGDTATTVKGSWWDKFWAGGHLKTGMDIRKSQKFQQKAKELSDEIIEANKRYQQGIINHDLGKIDKQELIRLHDVVRDKQFQHLSYTIQGVPKLFKQDAAMELGFAAGAVTVSELFGSNYEFIGGLSGGVGIGLGGSWVTGLGRTTYHALGSLLDGLSTHYRAEGYDVMRLKPEVLRNMKIYDKSIDDYRELKWYEFGIFEKFTQKVAEGGPDVLKHIQVNFDNYNKLVADVEKVIGPKNIHLFHEQFAIVSMLGPMMAARDAAQTQHSTISTLFSKENPEYLDSMKRHHYMLRSLKNVIDEISQKATRGVPGDEAGVIRGEFDTMQQSITDFVGKEQMELTKEFSRLMDSSVQFYNNIGNLDHPMWMDTEVLYQNLDRMDEFFDYIQKDPNLSELISKPQYEGLIDDVVKYTDGAKSINEQITRAIYNADLSTVPKNLESMQNRLAKSLVMMEKHHYAVAMKPYNKLYKKYKNAEIDGFSLFEDFWKLYGKEDNWLKGKRIFWRGNEKAPKEFRKIKGIFDEAAERLIQKLHVIEKGDAYIDGLTPSLRKLEYEKWFKQKQIALAEELEVKPNAIDHMTLFEYLRKGTVDKSGKNLELTFNLKELNKLRGEFQRIDFVLTKKGDTSANAFGALFESTDSLLDDLTVKYKEAHPQMKNELDMARENYKYNYANRYLDKESDIGKIGGHWISYSQLGKEFTVGPYTPGGRTFTDHPTKWINFNAVKKNPELFRDQISMAMGKYVPGKGYIINPTSAESLMWQAFVTRLVDESLANEFKKNIGKFTNGTYRILGDEVVDAQGHSINLFHDIYKLADSLTFDTVDGGKWAIYNVDNLVNNEKAVIKELGKNKNLVKELENLKSEIIRKSTVDGAAIRKANQIAERKVLDSASRINKGLNDTKSFVEHFIGQTRDIKTGSELILLKETLIKQGVFKNEKEVNKAIASMVGDYISMTFGPKRQAGKIITDAGVEVIPYKARTEDMLSFDFDGFKTFLDDTEPALRQILDEEHLNYLRSSADLFSIVSRDMMKIGDNAAAVLYPGGLGVPAILSRVYGLARGVIGFRFVASEMAIRMAGKSKGNFIKEMVQNKDAAKVMNEIIERGMIDVNLDNKFRKVIFRVIAGTPVKAAYIETGIIEPESEKLDIPSFFGLGIPWVDTERILKTPAEFIEGRTPDMSQQEQYTTMYPKGSLETGGFPAEEHMKAYERPTEKEQMEKLGFPF
jgi:hypothetical protein